jgi:hypothetical protein
LFGLWCWYLHSGWMSIHSSNNASYLS